jgi:hypothetical protein
MRRLLVAGILALAWAAPALAQPPEPGPNTEVRQLTAVPSEVRAGDDVTVTGSGCDSGNQVRFDLFNPELRSSAEALARGDGTFVQSIKLPPTTKVGRTWLRATCLTPESEEKVMEAVLLVTRPQFVVTWTNVLFGIGAALMTAGIGLAMLRQPDRHGRTTSARHRRHRRHTKHRARSHTGLSRSGPAASGMSVNPKTGPELNGSRDSERSLEVD